MEDGPLIVSVDDELYIHTVSLLEVMSNFVNEVINQSLEDDENQEVLYGAWLSMSQLHDTILQSCINFSFNEITGGIDG